MFYWYHVHQTLNFLELGFSFNKCFLLSFRVHLLKDFSRISRSCAIFSQKIQAVPFNHPRRKRKGITKIYLSQAIKDFAWNLSRMTSESILHWFHYNKISWQEHSLHYTFLCNIIGAVQITNKQANVIGNLSPKFLIKLLKKISPENLDVLKRKSLG